MQNLSLQLDSSTIQNSLNSTVNTLIEQVTPELPHTSFVTDLAFIMIIGSIVTLAFFKIRQPLIIGYLFAGMLLGPLSPLWTWLLPENNSPSEMLDGVGILSDISALHLFSEIGVILLLFVIGIEFPYAKIKSIGKVSVGVGTLGLFSTLGVLFYASTALGLQFMDALFISAALSISSTAIIVKILEEMGKIKKESSILVLGILIVVFSIFSSRVRKAKSGIGLKIKNFIAGLIEGATSVFKMKHKWAFIFHTVFIWVMYIFMFWATIPAIEGLHVPFGGILIGFIAGGFSIAATNGGIGLYPIAVAGALALFGVAQEPATAFGWIMWTAQTAMIIIFGGLAFLLLPIYNKNK